MTSAYNLGNVGLVSKILRILEITRRARALTSSREEDGLLILGCWSAAELGGGRRDRFRGLSGLRVLGIGKRLTTGGTGRHRGIRSGLCIGVRGIGVRG